MKYIMFDAIWFDGQSVVFNKLAGSWDIKKYNGLFHVEQFNFILGD